MMRQFLKSKIMNAKITRVDLEYEGSLGIPRDILEKVDILPGEKILVANKENGARFETYAIESESGFFLNGAAAHLGKIGDRLIIMSFGISEETIVPKKVLL